MSSKPILFNTEMVKAILDGRKTQTRRVIPLKNNDLIFTGFVVSSTAKNREGYCAFGKNKEQDLEFIKPKYKVGDVLWVREPAKVIEINDYQDCFTFKYLADNKEETLSYLDKWENKDGMTVPRWVENCQGVPNGCIKEMARIFLKVTNVRVERLQDITAINMDSDMGTISPIISKLIEIDDYIKLQNKYKKYWNSTAKDGYKWEDNPYVFVYEFERIEKQ